MPANTYRVITVRQKSLYISKNDELYIQPEDMLTFDIQDVRKGMLVTFKLGRTVRIYGEVSRKTNSGFFVKNWSINNKGEKFANDNDNS